MNFFYKKYIKAIILIASIILLLFLKTFDISCPQKVTDVIDGDTIQLADKTIVRYLGIDTPEIRRKSNGEWIYDPYPFSEKAKQYNKQLVKNKIVKIKTDMRKKDKFNRLLGYIYPVKNNLSFLDKVGIFLGFSNIGLKEMANIQILKQGLAIMDVRSEDMKYLDVFVKAQQYARENENGFWENNLQPVASENAKFHLREVITIQGKVTSIKKRGIVLILTLDKNFPIVIFESNLKLFYDISIDDLLYKEVEVFGMVKEYKSKPQIIICHPSQISIVK